MVASLGERREFEERLDRVPSLTHTIAVGTPIETNRRESVASGRQEVKEPRKTRRKRNEAGTCRPRPRRLTRLSAVPNPSRSAPRVRRSSNRESEPLLTERADPAERPSRESLDLQWFLAYLSPACE